MASRSAALVLAVLFGFRIAAVGGALVCTAHGSHSHVAEAEHHGEGSGHDGSGTQNPCDTSDRDDCCAAMASCSVVLAAGTVVAAVAALPDHDDATLQLNSAFLSRLHSPDPPPPKS